MQIQPFQSNYPDMRLVSSTDHFFSSIKEKFNDYWLDGYYRALPREGLYACTIERSERTHTGLIGCVDIREYFTGHIKRHERTMRASEEEQINQLLNWSAQVKPVMLTYRHVGEIENILSDFVATHDHFLEVTFETNGEIHRFWQIQDTSLIERLQKIFKEQVSTSYISDGHHRTSSNALMFQRLGPDNPENPFRWLPCSFFSDDEIEIYDYNRIIQGLNGHSPASFMALLSDLCEIEVLENEQKPVRKYEMTLYLDKTWYHLKWRPEVLQAYDQEPVVLDVILLNKKILMEILDIRNLRTDIRVKYIAGNKTLSFLRKKTLKEEERFAFCLYPVTIEDFLAISDADGILPPKSTWFEPRIRSGQLVRRLDLPLL